MSAWVACTSMCSSEVGVEAAVIAMSLALVPRLSSCRAHLSASTISALGSAHKSPRNTLGAAAAVSDTCPGNQSLSSSTEALQESSNCADRAVRSGRHNGSTSTRFSNVTLPNSLAAKRTRSSAASRNRRGSIAPWGRASLTLR